MAKLYNVSYDLNKPGKNYDSLHEELKKSLNWWHHLDSTWLILTNETAEQLWNRISIHVDKNDTVLIMEVRKPASGWLTQQAWDWINQNGYY